MPIDLILRKVGKLPCDTNLVTVSRTKVKHTCLLLLTLCGIARSNWFEVRLLTKDHSPFRLDSCTRHGIGQLQAGVQARHQPPAAPRTCVHYTAA
jgi:hypothetical protein